MARKNKKQPTKSISTSAPAKTVLPYELKSVSRTRKDVRDWNRGIDAAQYVESPQNWLIQLLYDEVEYDALLTSQTENRTQQIFRPFTLKTKNGEIDKESTDFIKKTAFYRDITKHAMNATYRGYSLVEIGLSLNDEGELTPTVELLPRTNTVPQSGKFYLDYQNTGNFIEYRKIPQYGTTILEFNTGTLGLLNKAVSHALFKRFVQSCWSELCEIYGIPPRVLKTNTRDKTMLDRGDQMMRDMGAAAYFIIDETESFEFAKGVSTSGEVYDNFIRLCNSEMSLLISGAVMGQDTKNGSRSKDESAQEILESLVQSDMNLMESYWNHTIIPALVRIGILKPGLTFEFDKAEDTGQLFEFTKGLLPHYKISPKWIKEKFGVEVLDKTETPDKEEKQEDEKEDPKNKQLSADHLQGFFDSAR